MDAAYYTECLFLLCRSLLHAVDTRRRQDQTDHEEVCDHRASALHQSLVFLVGGWVCQGVSGRNPIESNMRMASLTYTHTHTHTHTLQGDRMWAFAISLLLVSFYPESLLMPGVYGFLQGLSVVVFGTVVGDWVDFNPRLRGEGAVGGCGGLRAGE